MRGFDVVREQVADMEGSAPVPGTLTVELVAQVLGPRVPETKVKAVVAGESARVLSTRSVATLEQRGLTTLQAHQLRAAMLLGGQAAGQRLARGKKLHASREIFAAYHPRMRDLPKEEFRAVLLDAKNRVMHEYVISQGILTASLVHPREVYAVAIEWRAAGIVLVHNHPSGDPEPSPEDLEVTRRLEAVGELVGVRVLDHVVIGDGRYVSFLERGLIAG